MEETKKYSNQEALEEASKIKDLVGDSGSRQDYDEAEKIIEEEARLSLEAQKAIGLYHEFEEAVSEEDKEIKALAFARHMSSLVEPDPRDPGAEKRWDYSARGQAKDSISPPELESSVLIVGSGTAGCRIKFTKRHPDTYEPGRYMYYYKPSESNWLYGGKYWENYMKHFKKEIIRLD